LKLHIDTDIGGNIDDLCALALVLAWPGVELTGITTVAEHQGKRAGYVKYALELAGREDVDVAAGADVALNCYRDLPRLLSEPAYWPGPIPPYPTPLADALTLLQRSIEQDATIAAIGPCTNLALLERRSPGILRTARIFMMGGFVTPPRAGFPQFDHQRDSNLQNDVQSAYDVLRAAHPTLVPISMTVETWLRRAHLPALRAGGPFAQLLARQADAYAADKNYDERYGSTCAALPADIVSFQHDPLTCALALGWNHGVVVQDLSLRLDIEDGWLHQTLDDAGSLTKVVTRVDGPSFSDFWVTAVTQAPIT
jgi:inosine-uridine nucleoside N-ribohydrolase